MHALSARMNLRNRVSTTALPKAPKPTPVEKKPTEKKPAEKKPVEEKPAEAGLIRIAIVFLHNPAHWLPLGKLN